MLKGSIGFPVEPLVFKMYVRGQAEKGRGLLFLFDDLPQKLKGVFAQRRSHGNELDNIEPAFPAFILRNVRLRHPCLHAPRQPGTLGYGSGAHHTHVALPPLRAGSTHQRTDVARNKVETLWRTARVAREGGLAKDTVMEGAIDLPTA